MSDRPNIVFLLNDHQLHYRHGWDAGPKIQRPHFERLAAQGVEFSRSYTACPLCAPARRTMLTGLFPHRHGQIRNGPDHPFDKQTYLEKLSDAGYRNFYYGKWHAGPGTAHDFGCEGFSYPGYNNPYTKPEYKDYLQRRGLPEPEMLIHQNFGLTKWKPGDHYIPNMPCSFGYETGILETPDDTHEAFFLANLACDQLRHLAKDKDGRPFALRVDFWGPHQPYFPTQRFADLYRAPEIPEYPSFQSDLSDKPDVYRRGGNCPMTDQDGNIIHPNPIPWSEWQRALALCYAHVTMVDAAGGLILDALDELGLSENTLVVWTSDHGDALGCHGGRFDKGSYMPEELLRVPFAMRFPGMIPSGQVRDELVSTIDIAPTLLDAAGTGFNGSVDGESLLSIAVGGRESWRESLMCETHGHFEKHFARAVIVGRHKYVENLGQMDELYDLETDPYERTNLINNQACQETLSAVRKCLAEWRSTTADYDTSTDSA
ncbi:MAG TPA: sulfatase-like hydrolase/transferase [bacterium]|nr:sulfatase-like hydrolase/transferase [bacterium]